MSRHQVPSAGAGVFRDEPDRVYVAVPVGGTILRVRWPTICAGPLVVKPITEEVRYLRDIPTVRRPLSPDPYGTLPIEEPTQPAGQDDTPEQLGAA